MPLGEFAFQFLKACRQHKAKIVYSQLVVNELKTDYSDETIKQVFTDFENMLIKAEISVKQSDEAENLAVKRNGVHKADALHAILARDNDAVLITRDWHFDAVRGLVEVMKPEEVIFY